MDDSIAPGFEPGEREDPCGPRRRLTVVREVGRGALLSHVADKYAIGVMPRIDCASRLHLCRARCCTLRFALSEQDVGEGVIRWDAEIPYQIARREDGYCVHNDAAHRTCDVYEARPATCRTYDCRHDRRIWIDFQARVPAS